jgi:hypothetical protein
MDIVNIIQVAVNIPIRHWINMALLKGWLWEAGEYFDVTPGLREGTIH